MPNKKVVCSVDIMDIKQKIASGRFAVKINTFGSILLEDTITCEAIQLMQLPEGYSFHETGTWEPEFIFTSHDINHPMEGHDGWVCSVCGSTVEEKYDWCHCGADMRKYRGMHEKLCKTYY